MDFNFWYRLESVEGSGFKDEKFDFLVGFRFLSTDKELINHYLTKKVADNSFIAIAIAEVDMNKSEPWDLPSEIESSLFLYLTFEFLW